MLAHERLSHLGCSVLLISFVFLSFACDSGKPKKPKVEPAPAATATEAAEDPDVVREQRILTEAPKLAQVIFDLYHDAKEKLAPYQGPVRFSGNTAFLSLLEVSAALPEKDVGFKSYEYRLNCDVPQPPPICAVAQAFEPNKIKEAARLAEILETQFTEVVAVGRADGVWKPRSKIEKYDGSCGTSVCQVEEGNKIDLREGLTVESNETLACLRALCLAHASRLSSTGVKVRVLAKVAREGARPEGRRAEIQFRSNIVGAARRFFWADFLPRIGHEGSGQVPQ